MAMKFRTGLPCPCNYCTYYLAGFMCRYGDRNKTRAEKCEVYRDYLESHIKNKMEESKDDKERD
jgi:hypothetical protein